MGLLSTMPWIVSPGDQRAHGRENVPRRRMRSLASLADGARNVRLCDRRDGLVAEMIKQVLFEEGVLFRASSGYCGPCAPR